ncbi:MAG TPA: peptidylprolyl isomerase [Candidatus Polarisedimenticolia bacterium]
MRKTVVVGLLAGTLVMAPALAKEKEVKAEPESPVVATVNGEPVTKSDWTAIMKADQWHGPTLKEEPGFKEKMQGKPYDDYFFTEEVVKIRAMAQKYKDALPQMKETIDAIYQKAKAGEDFAELAKQYSQESTASNGGDLGIKELKDMVFPFNRVMLSLKAGEISEPVLTIFGYHIIKVDKVFPPSEGKNKRVAGRHILIRFPSQDPRGEAVTLASQAKVEIVDKGLCKKLVSYCPKEH